MGYLFNQVEMQRLAMHEWAIPIIHLLTFVPPQLVLAAKSSFIRNRQRTMIDLASSCTHVW